MFNTTVMTSRDMFGSDSGDYGHCCPPVFDPYTLVALVGGIALATYFLRVVIVTTTFAGRSFGQDSLLEQFWNGKLFCKWLRWFVCTVLDSLVVLQLANIVCLHSSGLFSGSVIDQDSLIAQFWTVQWFCN